MINKLISRSDSDSENRFVIRTLWITICLNTVENSQLVNDTLPELIVEHEVRVNYRACVAVQFGMFETLEFRAYVKASLATRIVPAEWLGPSVNLQLAGPNLAENCKN